MFRLPPISTLFPYTTLFRSFDRTAGPLMALLGYRWASLVTSSRSESYRQLARDLHLMSRSLPAGKSRSVDRKSTRLNSSHTVISYAVFCLKKKKNETRVSDE